MQYVHCQCKCVSSVSDTDRGGKALMPLRGSARLSYRMPYHSIQRPEKFSLIMVILLWKWAVQIEVIIAVVEHLEEKMLLLLRGELTHSLSRLRQRIHFLCKERAPAWESSHTSSR